MRLNLGRKVCGEGLPPLMFAEEGQANQGDFNLALKMIEIAAQVGADGIEFQLALADELYIKGDPGYDLYLKREFSNDQIRDLVEVAKKNGLVFQAACLSPKLVDICVKAGVDVFCINAMDLNNPMMLDAVSATGLPFWLATLMATTEEIDWTVNYLKRSKLNQFGMLHGQHIMALDHGVGVPPEITQLDCIKVFKERYGLVTGFVDHTPTVQMPAIAVANGADLIMKHLAPESGWRGPDWGVSLNPIDWKRSRELMHYAARTRGDSKELSQAEVKDRGLQRRSLYTSRNLPMGHVLEKGDLIALRPGGGISPREMQSLIGRRIKRSLPMQYRIDINDIECF